jgi:large conductance mechanosensitive channel
MKGFLDFVREQGVVGLAVGFILGGAVAKLVSSVVNDLVNPILGIFLGAAGDLKTAYLQLGPAKLMLGSFIGNLIDFLVIAFVVYFGVKALKLDKLDKKKA